MTESERTWLDIGKFVTLLCLFMISMICSFFLFIYFYRQRKHISIFHHSSLILIVMCFLHILTDMPFVMAYYYKSGVAISTSNFCLWWNWWDYSTNVILVFLMTWFSLERHALVFHFNLFSKPIKHYLFHILYPIVFYLFSIITNDCENQWSYDEVNRWKSFSMSISLDH